MALEARLSLRQSQRLVMTPLLQQAIQLLQLSTLELQEVIQKELLENPLLEEVSQEETDHAEARAAEAALASEPASPASTVLDGDRTEELPFDLTAVMFETPEEPTLVEQEEPSELSFDNLVRSTQTLADHLEAQLALATEDGALRAAGRAVIGNLDEDGYLRAELGEIAELTKLPPELVGRALALVQSFDPTGMAARTLQECLLLQLNADPLPDPVAVEVVQDHFDALAHRRFAEIARALKLPVERIMEAVEEISALDPKPGRRFAPADTRYVVPDVSVVKMGHDYTVLLNDDGIPRLRLNALYRRLLRGAGDEARQYVEGKIRSALWLIKAVDQRQRTLRRVSQSIVKFQREFLDKGVSRLRPLSLRDVAEDVGMHESTISRVTTNKYVETPQGLFELKFFFHSGIATGNGEVVSSISVKKMIQDLLAREDPSKPLSDQEITQVLKERGLSIARRTVAKYREEVGLLPSHQRRLAAKTR
ncbi:MAG: RNA polymerase factor sigma-54 [Candidatus Rokubacteria bacterium]|nr:RNA polymerase factor sigma-54 [Candidatus Rokubacteria bacterium]